jgi:hypothetical protein
VTGRWPDERFWKMEEVKACPQIHHDQSIVERGRQVAKHKASLPQHSTVDGPLAKPVYHRITAAQG